MHKWMYFCRLKNQVILRCLDWKSGNRLMLLAFKTLNFHEKVSDAPKICSRPQNSSKCSRKSVETICGRCLTWLNLPVKVLWWMPLVWGTQAYMRLSLVVVVRTFTADFGQVRTLFKLLIHFFLDILIIFWVKK